VDFIAVYLFSLAADGINIAGLKELQEINALRS